MGIGGKLFAQSSDGLAVLKIEPWIVDSTTPYDGAEVANRIVEETWSCRDCRAPDGCEKHVQAYVEALAIDLRNR